MPPRRSQRRAAKVPSAAAASEEVAATTKTATVAVKEEVNEAAKDEPLAASETKDEKRDLSLIDKIRIENNKQRALQLRKQRQEEKEEIEKKKGKMHKVSTLQEVDTGGGFFLEEGEEGADEDIDFAQLMQDEPFVVAGSGSEVECEECCRPFALSFLKTKFSVNICDGCHDRERHKLITRTTAKTRYLLKDADLDKREPILRFITKKNPRNNHWGEMKLYLQSQCYDRAMEIWNSMEAIEEESTKRKILNAKAKSKKYEKKMAELKREVRSSLYKVDLAGHTHEWGTESYNEQSDEYTKQCTTCGHSISYEKM